MHVSLRSNRGFSLVELMVVVAIIGILAAIAVPNFQRFSAKAKQSEARASLSALWGAEASIAAEWQTYESSFTVVGYEPRGWVRYDHGFLGAGTPAAMPTGYSGPAVDAITGASLLCGAGVMANGCGLIILPIAPIAIAGVAAPTSSTFTAGAVADISGGVNANQDEWTITQNKQIVNLQNGLP